RAAGDASQAARERFAEILPRVIARFLGDGPAVDEAVRAGGFEVHDVTVVIRLNPQTDAIEFFADIGLPDPHALESAYRAALEINLCRTYPGIVLGLHPESGRLVATTSMHFLLVGDDDVCVNTVEMLTLQVQRMRDSREVGVA
uniref:hypothetical protein n=1 Tax=Acidovorax soli TaxID=592050 RepID=UPI0032B194A5